MADAARPRLRPFAEPDQPALYDIALLTGDGGGDATPLHREPRLIGEIYAAPYALLEPSWAFVAEDDAGVAGYVVGVPDTRAFERRLERDSWPGLRLKHPNPEGPPEAWSADQIRAWIIHHPRPSPEDVVAAFPAHLHMNLHPRVQGQGLGRQLLATWLGHARRAGVSGVHLGTNPSNERALRFWSQNGFTRLERQGSKARSTVWFGQPLCLNPNDTSLLSSGHTRA